MLRRHGQGGGAAVSRTPGHRGDAALRLTPRVLVRERSAAVTEIAGRKPRRSGRGEPGSRVSRASLLLDVFPDDARRSAPAGHGEVRRGPEMAPCMM
jgi:hypothetical protein